MNKVEYKVKHQYQPTNTSCSPTALSILFSYYGRSDSVDTISKSVPQSLDEKGQELGTINQEMAVWCLMLGFKVSMYTFDVQIIDMSWQSLSKAEVIKRLVAGLDGVTVPSLGKEWSKAYRQSYINFLKADGKLVIQPSVTSELLYKLLEKGPVLPCVCDNTLYGSGKSRHDGKENTIPDDTKGKATNHSIVIYGHDSNGNFLTADPCYKPGRHSISPERMIAAISTAQIECDNLLFQIFK
jgi:hypothetical protein